MNSTQAFLADQFIGDKPSKESKYTLLPHVYGTIREMDMSTA
jgi:hypothetical protein